MFALKQSSVVSVRGRARCTIVAKTASGKTASGKTASGKTASSRTPAAAAAEAPAGTWFPGAEVPEWLPAGLPGNRGFDPLGLAKEPEALARFTEAEIFHCRLAMLGALGALSVELLGYGNWWDATQWAVTGGKATYLGVEGPVQDVPTLIAIATGSFAFVESQRAASTDQEKKCYPGFNPAGLGDDDETQRNELRTKEIKNGRMAMVACLGFFAQHFATGKSPLENLNDHLSNPTAFNFTTNGVSLPA